MTDQKKILILVQLSLTNTVKRESLGPVGDKPVPDFNCVFVPTSCDFVDYHWLLSESSSLKKL